MRTIAAGVLVLLASCSPPPPEPTAIQRGALLFAPVADALGAGIAGDLKKANPAGYAQYLKEIGGKQDADLARKISKEILSRYADMLAVSSSKEADLKGGRFDDSGNAVYTKHLLVLCQGREGELTQVGRAVLSKVRSGEWKGGLELDFGVRILKEEAPKPEKPKKP
jgi:hypothetical protein